MDLSPKENILTTDEIVALSKIFVSEGITKIRLLLTKFLMIIQLIYFSIAIVEEFLLSNNVSRDSVVERAFSHT